MTSSYLQFLLVTISCIQCTAWIWANHGKPPVLTGMAVMMSGNDGKLFGVGNGNLQERYWTGTAWVWANHGAPWGLQTGERLASTPCVLTDGKLFVITNRGRLVERYWNAGAWHWAHHNKPSGVSGLRPIRCTCTTRASIHRVFVVGYNFKLYERYWSWSSNSWQWKYHGSPPGTQIGAAGIDSCNQPSCDTFVYAAGTNGNLYRRYITPANPGVGSWHNMGRPSGESVQDVTVGNFGGTVFISTYDNDVCQFFNANNFHCFGKPSGSQNNPSVAISKPVVVNNCPKLSGNARYVFMHSWDPVHNRRSRYYVLKVTGTAVSSWTYRGSISGYYIEAPESFLTWGCPRAFSTRSSGHVYELYV